jgi:hypothetical protein
MYDCPIWPRSFTYLPSEADSFGHASGMSGDASTPGLFSFSMQDEVNTLEPLSDKAITDRLLQSIHQILRASLCQLQSPYASRSISIPCQPRGFRTPTRRNTHCTHRSLQHPTRTSINGYAHIPKGVQGNRSAGLFDTALRLMIQSVGAPWSHELSHNPKPSALAALYIE